MKSLIKVLNTSENYGGLIRDIKTKNTPILTSGIIEESIPYFLCGLMGELDKQILLIAENEVKANRIYEDLKDFGIENLEYLPKREMIFYDINISSKENNLDRLKVMDKLIRREKLILVSSIEALLDKVLNIETIRENTILIRESDEIEIKNIGRQLLDIGYERVEKVESKGEFSQRGGIIDIFSPNYDLPHRIELFGDEVDTIRTFNIEDQRSMENLSDILIFPANDILLLADYRDETLENLRGDLGHIKSEKYNLYLDKLENSGFVENKDLLIPYIPKGNISSILNYLEEEALIFLEDEKRIDQSFIELKEASDSKLKELFEMGEILNAHFNYRYDYKEIMENITSKNLIMNNSLLSASGKIKVRSQYEFSIKETTNYQKKLDLLVEDLKYYKARNYKVLLLAGNKERVNRFRQELLNYNIDVNVADKFKDEIKEGQIHVSEGSLRSGFQISDIKFILISDREVFGEQKKRKKKTRKKGEKILNIGDLNIGAYVVHENHGIGKYEGIEQLNVQGVKKDYITIAYKGEDKLYIPIDQMNLIQKYVGGKTISPKLNKLNSGEWKKTKARAKKALEDMAGELLEIYAKRESLKGYSFSPDTPWQRQFEDLFPYEETDGQLLAIEEIKRDMERERPMDRLLCGDVGYGKTEVALRAAFKALIEGKQVAILVPTTILAQQHYNTIVERFKDFPIKAGLLSRFKSGKNQKLILEGLKNGVLDIVVGTHKLLSKDIVFKDLGLLIIDEEQRFGVKHKEGLKKLRENIDVLTLSATPIPRTLHMSLIGIRDMSILDEPPEHRYPIQTYVVEFNQAMVRDAILKEISRGGQVYFVYNRVETILEMQNKLRKIVPEASIEVAHGQMGERQLENTMMDFLEGEIDVLLCTTIIETGLDISNVNTIIVYDADKMGLSQLYQLRGRVGRSNRIAYGYFLYEKSKVLTSVAEKRLRAIKEFTEFGSGYKIAMRDLEIRGAGNILGAQQHGHMESIGHELYLKFLSQAIARLKGDEIQEKVETSIDINIDGYIPESYIDNESEKIEIYKKIAVLESKEDYLDLSDELIDRFGDIPKPIINLMDISYIKSLASVNRIFNIVEEKKGVKLELIDNNISLDLLNILNQDYKNRVKFDLSSKPNIFYYTDKESLSELKVFIEKINTFKEEKNTI